LYKPYLQAGSRLAITFRLTRILLITTNEHHDSISLEPTRTQ